MLIYLEQGTPVLRGDASGAKRCSVLAHWGGGVGTDCNINFFLLLWGFGVNLGIKPAGLSIMNPIHIHSFFYKNVEPQIQ